MQEEGEGEGEGEEGKEEEEEEEEEAVSVRSLTVAGSNVYLVVSSMEISIFMKKIYEAFFFNFHAQLHENSYLPDPLEVTAEGVGGEGIAAALDLCDVAGFLYDSSDPQSFRTAAGLYVSTAGLYVSSPIT